MTASTPALTGPALLDAVTVAMVALHRRHHGRAPVSAYSTLIDDELCACVMDGVYTEVEKTLIELERAADVRHARNTFHTATRQLFIGEMARLSGRQVTAFTASQHIGPDMQILLFVLAPTDTPADHSFEPTPSM